jgi:Cys-tRNA synthase (O-phospho-L-seryl-tRNA:Cys-tRNA synthase)
MKTKDFDNLLQTVEFELTQRQRFLLFEELYTKYSFDDMTKFEKTMLKQIKSSVEMLSEETAKNVTNSCDTILKSYKEWKR